MIDRCDGCGKVRFKIVDVVKTTNSIHLKLCDECYSLVHTISPNIVTTKHK